VSRWKRRAERFLVGCGVPKVARQRSRPSTTILAYHNIVPRGEAVAGERNLHIDQNDFADQLDLLLEDYDVVSLTECFAPHSTDRNRVVITFDDAYLGTMTAGLDELAERGLPCTVFVPPGLLGAAGFWWDRLADGAHALPEELRRHCLDELQGRHEPIISWAKQQGLTLKELPPHARPVDESTLPGLYRPRLTLGAHTWDHPNLASLPPTEIDDQFLKSKTWLRSRAGEHVDWLAYPYGLYTPEVAEAASRHFAGSLLIEGRLAEQRGQWVANPQETPRIVVPRGITLQGLALQVSGIWF
jgi:peptidoglycan/xylan/chitin deacetylase (PgdA/CDA1 family)